MKKNLSQKALSILFLIILIFQMGCKKSTIDSQQQVPIKAAQQNKVIYLDNKLGTDSTTLWIVNYDGTNNQKINVTLPPNAILRGATNPKVSLDHKKIYFNVYQFDSNFKYIISRDIYSCYLDGSNVQKLIAGPSTDDPNILDTYYESNQGKILYAKLNSYSIDIWKSNLDGTNQQKINIILPSNAYYIDMQSLPQVTPDGKTIFFDAPLKSGNSAIFKCSVNGGSAAPISPNATSDLYKVGNFYYGVEQGKVVYWYNWNPDIITLTTLANTVLHNVNLTVPDNSSSFSDTGLIFSPDGNSIFRNLLIGNYNEYGIFSTNSSGGNLQQLVRPQTYFHFLYLSDAF